MDSLQLSAVAGDCIYTLAFSFFFYYSVGIIFLMEVTFNFA